MSKIRNFLSYAFRTYPVASNSVLYGALFVGAELSQQVVTKKILPDKPTHLDTGALARFGIFGTAVQGPVLTVWYRYLDQKLVGTSIKTVVKKVMLDQFIMTPQLYIAFFVAMSFMEGKADVLAECREKLLPAFKISCVFWIPAQAINFLIIPPMFRVTYVGACAFAWVNILCWIKRQSFVDN